jgi:3-oxoacyl-[acyl-carrier protein] reductase
MAMAREVASRNITCNAVAPGFIETSMTAVLSEEFKQSAKEYSAGTSQALPKTSPAR